MSFDHLSIPVRRAFANKLQKVSLREFLKTPDGTPLAMPVMILHVAAKPMEVQAYGYERAQGPRAKKRRTEEKKPAVTTHVLFGMDMRGKPLTLTLPADNALANLIMSMKGGLQPGKIVLLNGPKNTSWWPDTNTDLFSIANVRCDVMSWEWIEED